MTFSEDEHYLLIYYQLIDNNQIRGIFCFIIAIIEEFFFS